MRIASGTLNRRRVLQGVAGTAGLALCTSFGRTAWSSRARPRVAVLGGGIAGMTAAHELAERGFAVSLYEARDAVGGKARSFGAPGTGKGGRRDLPAEHGFRFFPGFYRHLPDTMGRIPLAAGGQVVLDNLVATKFVHFSRAGAPDIIGPAGTRSLGDALAEIEILLRNQLGVPIDEVLFFVNKLRVWLTSCTERRFGEFEKMSWLDYTEAASKSPAYQKYLAAGLTRSLVAARADLISARTAASIFIQLVFGQLGRGPAIDRVLNGPTNDAFIDPWVRHLQALGVDMHYGAELTELRMARGEVKGAQMRQGGRGTWVDADAFVLALPMNVVRTLLPDAAKAEDPRLGQLGTLVTEWMNGIQIYLDTDVPIVDGHTAYYDAPWGLTSISQKQFWPRTDLSQYGDGTTRGVLSVDIANWVAPGILFGKPARQCTRAEISEEVLAQLRASFDPPLLAQFAATQVLGYQLDPAITFPSPGVTANDEPLFINTAGSWSSRPEAVTAVPNLFLAGDYVRTFTDLATMEAANESGRRAANGVMAAFGGSAAPCELWPLDETHLFDREKADDRSRYAAGLPNIHA